ncbi:MAG: hypothetical protein ISR47_04500 [Rhodospirillales bacterium]|nr:hypothetical protein [Rhodospirillales bacterium]
MGRKRYLDFAAVNSVAIRALPGLVRQLLPDGRFENVEWVARNPRRKDRHLGSFKINTRTGKWADFATGDRGGDVISLVSFIRGIPPHEAALTLMEILGVQNA